MNTDDIINGAKTAFIDLSSMIQEPQMVLVFSFRILSVHVGAMTHTTAGCRMIIGSAVMAKRR